MKNEPLITIGSIGAVIGAFIVLMQSFGIPITDAQSAAINNFVVIAAPLVVALVARQFVWSPASAEKLKNEAYQAGLPPTEPNPDMPSSPNDL